jgi:hypothetical protein
MVLIVRLRRVRNQIGAAGMGRGYFAPLPGGDARRFNGNIISNVLLRQHLRTSRQSASGSGLRSRAAVL